MKTTKYKFYYSHRGYFIPCKGHSSREAAEREIGILHDIGFDHFTNIESYEDEVQIKIDVSHVNRVEIIGEGREFVRHFDSGEFSLQDSGRTMKIFVGRE